MRALLIAAAAVTALLGLAGCARDTESATSGPTTGSSVEPPSTLATPVPPVTDVTPTHPTNKPKDPPPVNPSAPVSLSPTGPVVPPGVEQVPAAQIDASAVPEYYEHRGQVWVYDDGYSLQMFAAASSGCGDAVARIVDQTPRAVRITLQPLPQPQGGPPDGTACTTVMTPRPVTVTLDAPLGDRMIYLAGGR